MLGTEVPIGDSVSGCGSVEVTDGADIAAPILLSDHWLGACEVTVCYAVDVVVW